jgi:hypothetical protein
VFNPEALAACCIAQCSGHLYAAWCEWHCSWAQVCGPYGPTLRVCTQAAAAAVSAADVVKHGKRHMHLLHACASPGRLQALQPGPMTIACCVRSCTLWLPVEEICPGVAQLVCCTGPALPGLTSARSACTAAAVLSKYWMSSQFEEARAIRTFLRPCKRYTGSTTTKWQCMY